MTTNTLPALTTNIRLDEHWVLVRLPILPPMPLPRVGQLNSSQAVRSLYL